MADELGRDLPADEWASTVVGSLMQPLEWLAAYCTGRTPGSDLMTQRTNWSDCLQLDAMYIRQNRNEDEEWETVVEAAISALCQSSALLFSQVAEGRLTKDQIRKKIESFLTE